MFLNEILILKKDGTREEYKSFKIEAAIKKSEQRCLTPLKDEEISMIISLVERELLLSSNNEIPVERIHAMVINALEHVRPDVAKSYVDYRNLRKGWSKKWEVLIKKSNSLMFLGDKDNANVDSKLASTISCLMGGYLGEAMYEEIFLTQPEKQAAKDGYIYIHDKDKRYNYPLNCCLFNIKEVLQGGFEMSNIWYNEPKSLDVAFDVIGDITLMAASQQYGGFTLPQVDNILEPYAQKSYEMYRTKYISLGVSDERAGVEAKKDVLKDMRQGFQGWEYKFNTVASSRGDYPFITATFGLNTTEWGRELSLAILNVRREGQGKQGFKKPVLFPKLVFLYGENLHGKEKALEDVFEAGILCSAKTMYPDWLSLTGDGYVASIYKKYNTPISPMGCRAFLSPWYEKGGMDPADENDKPVFEGRFNIGAISLHLPMIYKKAEIEGKNFYEVLDHYLQMIRRIHCRTYDHLAQMPASKNPLAFCEGGLYGGHLNYDDKIEPVLKTATASFGITALNELEEIAHGKSLVEDGSFALAVMKYINDKVTEFKMEDGHLYAIYGTPAEKLCGKQVEQYRTAYGIQRGVSDRAYVSNSFHCHVTEQITPIEKQNLEYRFWNYFNGGKIQYVRYPINYNLELIRILVHRAMEMGLYEGVNLSLAYCDDCGHEELEMNTCPICGSKNLTKIDRMNGYLSFSRVRGDTRLNDAKMAEINDRISM